MNDLYRFIGGLTIIPVFVNNYRAMLANNGTQGYDRGVAIIDDISESLKK